MIRFETRTGQSPVHGPWVAIVKNTGTELRWFCMFTIDDPEDYNDVVQSAELVTAFLNEQVDL